MDIQVQLDIAVGMAIPKYGRAKRHVGMSKIVEFAAQPTKGLIISNLGSIQEGKILDVAYDVEEQVYICTLDFVRQEKNLAGLLKYVRTLSAEGWIITNFETGGLKKTKTPEAKKKHSAKLEDDRCFMALLTEFCAKQDVSQEE